MTGHGSKFPRKMHEAVIALLTARNLEEAAKMSGVSAKTLQRWQKLPEFEKALRNARTTAYRQSLGDCIRRRLRRWLLCTSSWLTQPHHRR
jgi:hypothetical protein